MRRRRDPDIYHAIADPTRRRILDLLGGGERAVMDIVAEFDVSQPAISQHLRVLKEVDLVVEQRDGRRRLYSLRGEPLQEVSNWLRTFERFWTEHLSRLGDLLDAEEDL